MGSLDDHPSDAPEASTNDEVGQRVMQDTLPSRLGGEEDEEDEEEEEEEGEEEGADAI